MVQIVFLKLPNVSLRMTFPETVTFEALKILKLKKWNMYKADLCHYQFHFVPGFITTKQTCFFAMELT